jgi:hypothetical protein
MYSTVGFGIRDPGSGAFSPPGSGIKKVRDPDPGQNIPDPQHCPTQNFTHAATQNLTLWEHVLVINTGKNALRINVNQTDQA